MAHKMAEKRMTAWATIIIILLMMFFSAIYISEHADHDCCGNDCPICAVMAQCSQNIKSIGTLLVAVFICLILSILFVKKTSDKPIVFFHYSLISQKVRLND